MAKMTQKERDAIRFARALHRGPLSPTAAARLMDGNRRRFAEAKEFAADNGITFWAFDYRQERYFWRWAESQDGREQLWKGMRTRMRRQVTRYRSAIRYVPGTPIKASGPTMSALYDGLVAVGILYWISASGSENSVPLADIHTEAASALSEVLKGA